MDSDSDAEEERGGGCERKGVQGGCSDWLGEGPWSLYRRAVGSRYGVWAVVRLFDRGCLDGFPEGSGLVSGAWGFAKSYSEPSEHFVGFWAGLWQLGS